MIVHVGGNIFLSSDSVKLGDFGLSVQLKNMTKTQPNEVKKQRGTIRESVVYMYANKCMYMFMYNALAHNNYNNVLIISLHGT